MSAVNTQGAWHHPFGKERCVCIRTQVEVGPERRR